MIRNGFDPAHIATVYKHRASAISVLTNEKYFQGSFDSLPIVSQIIPQPILCKDFIADPYQIYLAYYCQTGACLLMLPILDGKQYHQLVTVAHSLEMGTLTEVSNEEELERTITLGIKVVGINDHDLRDLSIDPNRAHEFTPKLKRNVTVISESDTNTYTQVHELSHFANDFPTGSALVAHGDLNTTVCRALLGRNKACGLVRRQGAKAAHDASTIYGGLIFVVTSPRCVNAGQAQGATAAAPLQYAGVLHNHDITGAADEARVLSLVTVQLRGNEDQPYIDNLREALSVHVAIWKALSVGRALLVRNFQHTDEYAFDNDQGRNGQRFD